MKNLLLAVLFAAASPVQAQMYKCVDERGVTHYSDKPLAGCKGKEVDIQPIPPVGGSIERRSEDFARDNADFQRRQVEREQAEAKEKQALERRCTRLRQEQARLGGGRRLAQVSPQGERIYMEDEEREKRLAQVRDELRACP